MAGQKFIVGAGTAFGVRIRWGLDPRPQISADLLADIDDTGYFASLALGDTIANFNVSAASDSGSDFGQDLLASWETFSSAILIEAGGLSLSIPGPDWQSSARRDSTEPYQWTLSSGVVNRKNAFVTAYKLLTDAQKNATTITLRNSLAPLRVPVDAIQTFIVGESAYTTNVDGHKRNTWTLDPQQQINADLLAADAAGYFGYFQFNDQLTSAEVSLNTSSALGGSVSVRGPDLTTLWETSLYAVFIQAGGLSLSIPGPAYNFNADLDHTEPYAWELSLHDGAQARAFFTAYALLSQPQKDATKITLRTSAPPAALNASASMAGAAAGVLVAMVGLITEGPLQATAEQAGASAGELSATASLKSPRDPAVTFGVEDFNQTGLEVSVLALVTAGAPEANGTVYRAASNGGPLGSVSAESDLQVVSGQGVTQIALAVPIPSIAVLQIWDDPSALSWATYFNDNPTKTARLQFSADGPAYELTKGTQESDFSTWSTRSANTIRAINAAIAVSGYEFILAIAGPTPPAVDLDATAGLAGSSAGALTATAELQTLDVLQPTAALAGASAGELVATASLLTPVTLNATVALAGESAGLLVCTAGLVTPRTLLLQDFNQTGLDVDVLGIFVAAAPANIYANSDRGGSQSPIAGSDFGIGSGETVLSRVIVNAAGAVVILNDNDKPTTLTMSAHFGSSNTDSDWTLYIQTLDGVASTNALGNTGGGFSQWRMGTDSAAIINAIGANDRVILAIARASAGADLAANAAFAGAAAGELAATASLLTPAVLNATASLAGESAGALVGTTSLLTLATLNATASMAGASAGALGARVSLSALAVPDALQATASLAGAAAGELAATASLLSLDVLRPTAAFTGESAGELVATASLLTPVTLNATASMSGKAKGLLKTAALLGTAIPVTKLSAAALNRINAFGLHGNKPLTCIEIYHPDVPDNIRVVNDSDDLFIGPDRYLRAAFSATIPQDKEGELPRGELHIDNVGRAMVEWIELSQGGRGAKISIREVFIPVAGNRIAEVSWEITGLDVGRIRMTNERVTAELTDNRVAKAPAVKLRHDVIESPGLQ